MIAESKTDVVDYLISLGADPHTVHEGAEQLRYLRLGVPYQWVPLERAGAIDTTRRGVYIARDLSEGDTVFRYEQGSTMTPVATISRELLARAR
ncbi:hypothetical protein [Nocardioides pakistanensis]